ncbi:META domain-containing protein [Kushneria indalinina]|uniref:Heat shock protein HslJ n=1 Tax=Kushneria indalinina DSM 14324 TaxID=1122140 RepID=A0A3D9DV45_9GAMM|nr:META domain-containing protein [Kushneria indalinina]REC94653.1 heat shock protein HslJ [Kushneria indalinina DSM 14324]
MRHAFRPTLTTLALATLMAGCASSGSSSSGYYATALTNISGARVNLTGNRLDAWVGCNHLSANARQSDATLEVGDIASSDMACQPSDDRREQVLAEFLKRGPKLDKTGDMWLLRDNVHAVVVHTNTDPQLTHASFGPNPAGRSPDASDSESALAMDRAIERETREQATTRPASRAQAQPAAVTPAAAAPVQTAAVAPTPAPQQPAPEPVAERPKLQFYSQVEVGAPVTNARSRAVVQAPSVEPVNTTPERAPIGLDGQIRTGDTVAPAPTRSVAQAPAVEPINTAAERASIGLDSQIRTGDTVAPAPVRTVAQAPAVTPINTAPERTPIGLGGQIRTGDTLAPAPTNTVAQAPTAEPTRAPIGLNDQIATGEVAAAPAPAQQTTAQEAPAQVAQSRPTPREATTMALAPREAVQATSLAQEETRVFAQQSPRLDLWQQMGADSWQLAPQHTPQESTPWQPAVETSRHAWFASLLKGDTTNDLPDMTVTAPREVRSYAVRESNQWVLYSGEPIDQAQEKVLSDEQHQKNTDPELTDRDAGDDNSVITTSRLDESALERGVRATTSRALNWMSARWQA